MNHRAFVIAGDQAAIIANDLDDCRYRAAVHYVPMGVQVPTRSHDGAETQFVIEVGTLEFMVGGAATFVAAPGVIRVPPRVPYAYRNTGDETVRLLVHAAKPGAAVRIFCPSVDHAA